MLSISFSQLSQRLRASGSSALAISTVLTNVARLISTICLTRLLSPEVYGIAGMILSALFVINMISDLGFQAYIVRHQQTDNPDFLNAVWTIHASRGVLLTVVGILMAWPLAMLLGKPQLAAALAGSSFIFAINGLGSLNQFRALRDGRVQRFALMDFLPTIGQIAIAIILAFWLRNIWAIVGSMIAGSMIGVWLSYRLFPGTRRRIRSDREVAADLWRFSRMIAASSILYLIITQVDKLALSRILSLSQFGTYIVASTLSGAPLAFAFNYTSGIIYPATAAAWRDQRPIAETYYGCWGKFFYLYAFAGGGLVGSADLLIRILYDPRYLPAASYLSILAIATSMAMLTRAMQELMVANGRTQATFELHSVRLAWLTAGGLLALFRNNAMLLVLTMGLMEIPVYFFAAFRLSQLKAIRWIRELSVFATIALGFCVGSAGSFVARTIFPHL